VMIRKIGKYVPSYHTLSKDNVPSRLVVFRPHWAEFN